MSIVNYAEQYRTFRILNKSPSQPCTIDARLPGFKTRVQADNLVLENRGIYILLGGVVSCNTHEKCAGVYKVIPMVYFGGYMYEQYVYSVFYIMVYASTSSMFMVLHVVVHLSTKIYFMGWVNQHSVQIVVLL